MAPCFRRMSAVAVAASVAVLFVVSTSRAASTIPEIVVTPYYSPTSMGKVGSAVTVLTREQIERSSAATVAALLRTVPGVTVIEPGGVGATTEVRLRGAETGHTVVLIDGIRVNDPATARDEFDFSLISLASVERIEILRGPQSAVYGSDAMGGVVNIVTRKPLPGKNASASAEIGSYGSSVERLSGGAASGDFRFLMSGEHLATRGFSRVGNRDRDEPDGVQRWSGSFVGTYAPAGGASVEVGVRGTHEQSDYDGAPPSLTASCYQQKLDFAANAPNEVEKQLISGYGKVAWPSQDGALRQSITGFVMNEARDNTETNASFSASPGCTLNTTTTTDTHYRSSDIGAEYQAVADVGGFGKLLAGGRIDREVATYRDSGSGFSVFDSDRTRYALYAQDQVTLAERLNLSFTGRYDGEIDGQGFLTGRTTIAYGIPATGTKLRASAGTAAKRPTAYMIGYNLFSNPALPSLQPETSYGFDAGIDQSLFDDRLLLSVTGFYNRFSGLLTFVSSPSPGFYENIANASTAGVEVAATLDIVPGMLSATGSYTYLEALNLDTGKALPRRATHSGSVALTWTGNSGFEATLSAVLVGPRFNKASNGVPSEPLPGYARVDLEASYPLSPATRVFGRIENLANAVYQDPGGYNTAGLSAYIGLTWKQ